MLRKLLRNLLVWYVYFPHVTMLRVLGPHCALVVARVLSWAFWLSACIRRSDPLAKTLGRALPHIHPGLSISTAARRHLEVKHQYFAERQLYSTARGRRFVARSYRIEGREHLDAAVAAGRGVILLSHHFDMSRMMYPALHEQGYPNYQHAVREAAHAVRTYPLLARALLDKKVRLESASTVKIIYHQPGATFPVMARVLRQGGLLGIAGDGMAGRHFVEVPFLEGTMAFPTGPARLAARTGALLLTIMCLLDGWFSHRVIVYPPIICEKDSPACVEAATRAQASVLEQYIRERPWSWWVWRRLSVTETPEGKLRYEIYGPEED
jgi:KDO2-lipid IV(A) lauroyltransferase